VLPHPPEKKNFEEFKTGKIQGKDSGKAAQKTGCKDIFSVALKK
jgi:hypothetical protein